MTDINPDQAIFSRWYEEYREYRYLINCSDAEVIERSLDAMQSICTLTDKGQIGCVGIDSAESHFAWRIYAHSAEESRLRTGCHMGLFKKYRIKDRPVEPTFPNPPASLALLHERSRLKSNAALYKFGQRKYLKQAFDAGSFRLSPASSYNDNSLRPAIFDDELGYSLRSSLSSLDIRVLHPFKVQLSDVFGAVSEKRGSVRIRTNYYIWCASFSLDFRLFDDFEADSLLIIDDVHEFAKRFLGSAVSLLENWRVAPVGIQYFDPFFPTHQDLQVFNCKHFRYSRQTEFRFAFLPPSPVDMLEPLNIELGAIDDIARLMDRY